MLAWRHKQLSKRCSEEAGEVHLLAFHTVTLLGIYQLTHGSDVGRIAPSVIDCDSAETSP